MEQPPNRDSAQVPPFGPVLFVPPLRIVAPHGVPPCLPSWFNPQNPFNGFHPEMGAHAAAGDDQNANNGRPKSSAVRDLPPGCSRNGATEAGTSQAQAPASAFNASQPEAGKQSPSAASPSSTARKRKRVRNDKPKRPPARPPVSSPGTAPSTASSKKAVTSMLRLYDAIRRTSMLEEEMKGKETKGSRPDLYAGSVMNEKALTMKRSGKVVGAFPGVEVGDQFYFRMEICCIGLHGPIQGGIEYLTSKESEWDTPVAISIISSGGYDDRDDGEELIYTGQGGKSSLDSKPNEDQKLERGNLAMEGSMKHQVPVRVIRGIKDAASPSGKTYIYDGLYKVDGCWSEKGKFGFEEFKFRLRRLPGQQELGSAVHKLSNQLKYKPATRKDVCIPDLSNGKESLPVCVVNSVDSEHCPAPFEYSTSLQYSSGTFFQFGYAEGCDCQGVCSSSPSCSCFRTNKNAFAYLNCGALVKERGSIYECGSKCKCSPSCRNRLTQRALKNRLEIFKTQDRGWGLRSWDTIPAGCFVCEYTGRLIHNVDSLRNKDYVLNLSRLSKSKPLWGDISRILDSPASLAGRDVPRPELIIDASEIGNAARFINHSCFPNLLVQCVLHHQDTRRPHVMLFAMDNIPPFRELTIDYGSEMPTSDHQLQGKMCLCRSEDCRGRF